MLFTTIDVFNRCTNMELSKFLQGLLTQMTNYFSYLWFLSLHMFRPVFEKSEIFLPSAQYNEGSCVLVCAALSSGNVKKSKFISFQKTASLSLWNVLSHLVI